MHRHGTVWGLTGWSFVAVLAVLLSGCSDPTASLPHGRWAGRVTPQGAAAQGPANEELCTGPTHAILSFQGKRFQFEPNEGTLVLPGYVTESGKLSAELSRPGGNHQTYTASFSGQVTGRRISGLLVTPECKADVALAPDNGPGILQDLLRR
jgi:hypothetical protein